MKNNKKMYLLEGFCGENIELSPEMTKYRNNNTLAILLYDKDDDLFCDLTVNLPDNQLSDMTKNNIAFIDTPNCPWLPEFIKKYGLGHPTGNFGMSGFCVYPEYAFDLTKLNDAEG